MTLETTEFAALSIEGGRDAMASGRGTATSIVETCFAAIEAQNATVNAYLWQDREGSFAEAEKIDRLAATGDALPPLAGVAMGFKDVLCVDGLPATAGSRILEGYRPPYTATAVERLKAAGAIVLGKLNCDEFAMGSSNENSGYGPVRNPRALDRVPGGSSGGSAAAVAAGMAVATLGTDTGGSIRQPASFCGVVGLLPTYGRVSRYGLIAFASSLDHIGPLAHTAEDAAIMLSVIAGHDPMDSTSANVPVPDYVSEMKKPVRGMKLGIPKEYFGEGLDAEVRSGVEAAIQQLAAQGAEITPISLPHTSYAVPTYYVIATAEASANLARFDGVRYGYRSQKSQSLAQMYRNSRDEGFGAEVKRRIMLGTYALSSGYYDAYYLKAQKVRTLLARDFEQAFQKVDAIVTPTAPTAAFKIGEKSDDPLAMYLADIYTVTADLVGIPGISVPCGQTKTGLPIGLQILGKHFDEGTVLRVAQAVEQL